MYRMMKINAITAGNTNRNVRAARTWCSNSPLHSMWTPSGSFTFWATTPLGLVDKAHDVAAAHVERDVVRAAGRFRS